MTKKVEPKRQVSAKTFVMPETEIKEEVQPLKGLAFQLAASAEQTTKTPAPTVEAVLEVSFIDTS